MTIGENIKRIRVEKGLTQTQLSKRIGYESNSVLSKLENDHMAPNIYHLRRLSIALKVSQQSILDVSGEPDAGKFDDTKKEVIEQKPVTETKAPEVVKTTEEPIIKKPLRIIERSVVEVVVSETKEVRVKQRPFYFNVYVVILSIVLIAVPLLALHFSKSKEVFYLLCGSGLVIIVLLGSLIHKHHKDKKFNVVVKTDKEEVRYITSESEKKLVMFKMLLIILIIGFAVLAYFFTEQVKDLIKDKNILYALYGILGLSTILKLIASFFLPAKEELKKVVSTNYLMIITFIVDFIVMTALLVYFNTKNINFTEEAIYFLAGANLVSYIGLVLNNKFTSLFTPKF